MSSLGLDTMTMACATDSPRPVSMVARGARAPGSTALKLLSHDLNRG
jgi:hypothetical protein